MATNKHGTISAAEAREIVQAVQAGVGEGEVNKVLEDIMTKIRSEAGQGKSSTSFSLGEIYAGRLPSAVAPNALMDNIVEELSAQGYNVGADRPNHSIMVGWG